MEDFFRAAIYPTYQTRSDRLQRYRQLLGGLRAVTSNAQEDDVPAMVEIDGMKFWLTQELMGVSESVRYHLSYEAAPADVHRHMLDCVITATHLLRLWTNRPSVLQGSSAAPRLLTANVLSYVGAPWVASSVAKVRRHALTPGFLSAYAAACAGLAADLHKASCAQVPQHIAEMVVVLLWMWRAAMESFSAADGLSDPAMKPLVLPVAQLAVGVLRCWTGPSAAGVARSDPVSKAIDAAVDVSVLLVKGAADATDSLRRQHAGAPMMTVMCNDFAELHEVQWLLCCYVALIAQELHRQLQGRQPAVFPATGASKLQEQQLTGQQQQEQRVKVAPVHKRLLEGLGVPGLIGWEYAGHTSSSVWQEPQAYAALLGCAMFNSQLAYLDDRGRPRPQPATLTPPLLSATVHLRRAAVLLELCLLFPEVNVLLLSLQCMHKEVDCMYHCLFSEVGSAEATWSRVYAAVTSGITPTLVQQLLPVLARVLQRAVDEQVQDRLAYMKAAAELGVLLASVMQGQQQYLRQVAAALQQPSRVRALESSIRCWTHMHATLPGCLPERHQHIEKMLRLAAIIERSVPDQASEVPPGVAAAAGAAAQPIIMSMSSEFFALRVTCLKACVFAAAERCVPYPGSGSGASSSSSSVASITRVVSALREVLLLAGDAKAACSSLNSLVSSCSSKALMLPAWQLLLAHSLHAIGQLLLILHADGVLPASLEQHTQHPEATTLLAGFRFALEAVPAQLSTTVQAPAAAAAQGTSQKVDPCTSLLQQHEALSSKVQHFKFTTPASSTSFEGVAALSLGLKAAVSAELAQQLVDFAAALSGCFPAKLCCNAPGCSSLLQFSELDAVGGKSCMCARCKTARYCCRGCQEAHWKAHKHACKALAAQRQTRGSSSSTQEHTVPA